MAPILMIFGPNRSQRRNLFFEKFSNERRRHRGIVVVVIVAVVVAVVVVIGRFWVACIKGTSLDERGGNPKPTCLPGDSAACAASDLGGVRGRDF